MLVQLENAKEQEQELQILRLQHDQDVKARSNVQLTLKLSKTKSERYQRKMVDMSKRLQQAEEEVQRLKSVVLPPNGSCAFITNIAAACLANCEQSQRERC